MQTFWLDNLTAAKWFFRSLKKGDWLWLMMAVIIASMTVTVVKQLGETVQQSMLRKAAESLSADYVIRSSRPIEAKWQTLANELKLQNAQTTSVVTMALSNDIFQLVELKGVTPSYPLRGTLKTTTDLAFSPLAGQQAWIEPKLISLMQLNTNSAITLGTLDFQLSGSVLNQSSMSPMNSFAPQIIIPLESLPKTGLLGAGSRVSYELSVAGAPARIKQFSKIIEQQNNPHWQTVSAVAPTEDMAQSLSTAWLFLDLAALSAVLVAGMSILIASRFYLTRWQNSMALMRAFGASDRKMQRLFALQLTWIAVFSSLIGVALGYGLFLLLQPLLASYFQPLVIASPWPAILSGFISGVLVLWSFAWQAFQTALQTSPMQILKAVPRAPSGIHWFISFGLLLALISLMIGLKSITWILIGLILISLILLVFAIGLLKTLAIMQNYSRGWFRIALSNLLKEPGLVKIQLISVGMVLFVLMLMTFVRQDLLQNWQATLPNDTPNTFVMNIQPDQKAQVEAILAGQELTPALVPMARGRLVALNQKPLLASQQLDDRARRMLEREANIAVIATPPEYNEIIAQQVPPHGNLPWVSVEASMAELFNIQLGDTLSFNFAGQQWDYQVRSLRKVKWQSFQLNFFFIVQPKGERPLPLSYIGNFYLGNTTPLSITTIKTNSQTTQLTQNLAEQTPGVLLIDVRQIMQQIQDIMQQASWAVSGLYLFTLLASLGVLFTATLASQQSRVQSWLLLRTMGARNSEIIKIGLTEFALLGSLAGLLAATFAQLASLLISLYLLKTDPALNLNLWILSIFSGTILLLIIGLVTQTSFLRKSPQQLKRYLNEV